MAAKKKHERAVFRPDARTVVVIAGAAARGPYEAAAIAEVLPQLFPDGLQNVILLGTSAGAINAALLAANIGKGLAMQQAADEVKAVWERIGQREVFNIESAPVALARLGTRATSYLASKTPVLNVVNKVVGFGLDATEFALNALTFPARAVGVGVPNPATEARQLFNETNGFLDTDPLKKTAEVELDLAALKDSVASGKLLGVGFVATSCPMDGSGGRSSVFMYAGPKVDRITAEDDSSIDYVWLEREQLKRAHVLASAAIPVAFPPVQVEGPKGGWYMDGGVRLNTPVRPALDLDAEQLIVISSLSTEYPKSAGASNEQPDILDAAAQSIHVILGDGTIEDLRSLHRMNHLLEQVDSFNKKSGTNLQLTSERGKAYRKIAVLTLSPQNGLLSEIASKQLVSATGTFQYKQLAAGLASAGEGKGQNELASYLLFYGPYAREQFTLAKADVKKKGDPKNAFVL